jgi:glucose/arabinose dehydrogenase
MRRFCATAIAIAIVVGAAAQSQSQPQPQPQLRLRLQASGFSNPVAFVQDPSDRSVQFVVQQNGHVRAVHGATVLGPDFLDLSSAIVSGGEQGLLGLAFAPDTVTSGRFFVDFTNRSGDTVVARFRRPGTDPVADAGSRFDLRWGGPAGPGFIAQPFVNHNGGHLAFGPDGFLYIGLGDGGSADDPDHRAQNPNELLGKMLRVDVAVPDTHPTGYQIPPANPFVSSGLAAARPEIWAFGLRNPWRYTFDDPARGGTGALVIGDVGQNRYEEIDYEPAGRGGRNYGWRNREGLHDNVTSRPPVYLPLVDPIYEYDHSVGQSITGGFVYRGSALPAAYRGRYFFADFVQGRIFSIALTIDGNGEARASGVIEHTAELSASQPFGSVSSFGVDQDGELYLVSYSLGRIFKIVGLPAAPTAPAGPHIIR